MNTQQLSADINQTFEELTEIVSSFHSDQINVIPFEGSWTSGQVAEHILLSVSGFEQVINGPVAETSRAPDELKDKIKAVFLDFNTKMKSPEFIIPKDKKYEKQEFLNSFKKYKSKIHHAIATLDLTKTCLALELPVFGFLTRLECIYFILYHSQRHFHQLKNIHEHSFTIKQN